MTTKQVVLLYSNHNSTRTHVPPCQKFLPKRFRGSLGFFLRYRHQNKIFGFIDSGPVSCQQPAMPVAEDACELRVLGKAAYATDATSAPFPISDGALLTNLSKG